MAPLLLGRRGGPIEGSFGLCAQCGKPALSLTYFADFRITRKCGECGYEISEKPPQLQKRIVYLDQWVISEIANTLDPILSQKKGARVDRAWLEVYQQLERLVKLHAVVYPESNLHFRESLVTPYLGVLQRVYEHLATGVSFKEALEIHTIQLYDAFKIVVLGDTAGAEGLKGRRRVLHGTLNEWSDDVRIAARFPLRAADVSFERLRRDNTDRLLGEDTERWRNQSDKTFGEWFDYYRRDLTNVVLHCFDRSVFGPYWMVCRSMVEKLTDRGLTESAAIEKVREFLLSDEATRVPYCEISALLYAGMAQKVAKGQKSGADHSSYNDIDAISAFLPYCDAITVDNYFEELLRKPEISCHLTKYGAVVFSPNRRSNFLAYLQQLEDEVSDELRNTVLAVYGSSWLKPYATILEYYREKESKHR